MYSFSSYSSTYLHAQNVSQREAFYTASDRISFKQSAEAVGTAASETMFSIQALSWAAALMMMFIDRSIAGRVITDKTLNVAMSAPWTGPYTPGKELSCGFIVGLETVKKRQLLPGYTIKYEVCVWVCLYM